MKKYIFITMTILFVTTIFLFSTDSNSNSKTVALSEKVVSAMATVNDKVSIINKDSENHSIIIKVTNYVMRKGMHLTLYCILGILIYTSFSYFNVDFKLKLPYVLLLGLLIAVSDEYIQIFSKRTSSVKDVILDFVGVVLGVIIIGCIKKPKKLHI